MTSIFSYETWIEITSRGTSGDQVSDILESWEQDKEKLLEANREMAEQRNTKQKEILRLKKSESDLVKQIEIARYALKCISVGMLYPKEYAKNSLEKMDNTNEI